MNSLIFPNQPKTAKAAVGQFALTSSPRNEALGRVRILLQSPGPAAAYQAYGAMADREGNTRRARPLAT
jgi:hypothetical protein